MGNKTIYHIIAIVTAAIWGTTFISSKILLEHGLSPAEIMILRFAMAYVCMLPFWRGGLLAKSWRDELLMVILGITGGSMYFLLENTALVYTQASNVAIIIASTPLLTTLAVHFISRQERADKRLYACSLLSLVGVALVVLNGEFILKLNPMGDLLTLGAAVMWVIYSIIVLKLEGRYHPLMITRKIFFYGVLTLAPYFLFEPWSVEWQMLADKTVAGNLLFLGLAYMLLVVEYRYREAGRYTRHKLPIYKPYSGDDYRLCSPARAHHTAGYCRYGADFIGCLYGREEKKWPSRG